MKHTPAFTPGWIWLGLAMFAASAAPAADTLTASRDSGNISGRVQNAGTGAYLEGAVVTLEPSHQTTLTSRDGSFIFPSLPPGEHRILVSYTGLDPQTLPVGLA